MVLVSPPRIVGSRSYLLGEGGRAFSLVPRSAISSLPVEVVAIPLGPAWKAPAGNDLPGVRPAREPARHDPTHPRDGVTTPPVTRSDASRRCATADPTRSTPTSHGREIAGLGAFCSDEQSDGGHDDRLGQDQSAAEHGERGRAATDGGPPRLSRRRCSRGRAQAAAEDEEADAGPDQHGTDGEDGQSGSRDSACNDPPRTARQDPPRGMCASEAADRIDPMLISP